MTKILAGTLNLPTDHLKNGEFTDKSLKFLNLDI